MQHSLYTNQRNDWPTSGKHILAQYDDDSIIVYQAYKPSIGQFAAEYGYFGGDYSYNRMSWIKPNFLWMMYRCGWASKEGQETVLAITIPRALFDTILESAVASSFAQSGFSDHAEWKAALATSDVRLQWDPDHCPLGEKQERRAIQLGLRGSMLQRFAREELIQVSDITDFVKEQSQNATGDFANLLTPTEQIYLPNSRDAINNVQLDTQI